MPEPVQTLAILFADIGGSTRLYEQMGDVEAHRHVVESLAFMERAIVNNGGTLLRTVGDASLASFTSCDDALHAAIAMQHLHRRSPLSVRIGFHFGPVIPDKGDVYGNAVNIASRVATFARVDEITATERSVGCLSPANQRRATLLDTTTVKGVSGPIGIYRIAWLDQDDSTTVVTMPPRYASDGNINLRIELRCLQRILQRESDAVPLSIGRASDNDLPVPSDRASRYHARLEWDRGQFLLVDESTNGTFLEREDQPAIFLRRKSMPISGTGRLGIGGPPGSDDLPDVFYRVVNPLGNLD